MLSIIGKQHNKGVLNNVIIDIARYLDLLRLIESGSGVSLTNNVINGKILKITHLFFR
jgi:hypothetical protein